MSAPSISRSEQRRWQGYTRNLAHQIAHFTAGYQVGFDLDRLPRQGRGTFSLDLVADSATLNGAPAAFQVLAWCRDMLFKELAQLGLAPDWVVSARVEPLPATLG